MAATMKQAEKALVRLEAAREERLALQRRVDELKQIEDEAEPIIVAACQQAGVTGLVGRSITVSLRRRMIAVARNWAAVYAWIAATGSWDVLQQRINTGAVSARLNAGIEVPGIATEVETVLSISANKEGAR